MTKTTIVWLASKCFLLGPCPLRVCSMECSQQLGMCGKWLSILSLLPHQGRRNRGATGARAPLNFPVGGLKLTKLVRLDTVAALIIMRSNAHSGLRNLDNFNISLTVN